MSGADRREVSQEEKIILSCLTRLSEEEILTLGRLALQMRKTILTLQLRAMGHGG
jgi:hypothetical protein